MIQKMEGERKKASSLIWTSGHQRHVDLMYILRPWGYLLDFYGMIRLAYSPLKESSRH